MKLIWYHILFLWITTQFGITSARDKCASIWGKGEDDKGLILSNWSTPSGLVTYEYIVDHFIVEVYRLELSEFAAISSIASNPSKKDIFLMIGNSRQIYRISNFDIWIEKPKDMQTVWLGISPEFSRMAFDWVTENIYWTDTFYKWIGMKPAYSSDPTMYTTISHLDMDTPQGIALDPEKGFLFWSDNGATVRIERATLAGHDRKVLVHTSLITPDDLSVDTQTKILYWTDSKRGTIESINYNGENRRVIRSSKGNTISALDYYKGKLYVFDYDRDGVARIDAVTGNEEVIFVREFKSKSIHIYAKDRYPRTTDPCAKSNCAHMCVNTPLGPKCLCKSNYVLSEDNKTCSASSRYLERSIVATNVSSICVHDFILLDTNMHCYTKPQNVGPIALGLDGIFYVDFGSKEIKYLTWNDQVTTRVTQAGTVTSMVYTWIDNLLFWIDEATSSIKFKDLRQTATTSANLYTNIIEPSHLTMDPHDRCLFFITGPQRQKVIAIGDTSGRGIEVVCRAGILDNPIELNYDLVSHRLFFIDKGYLTSVFIDGTGMILHKFIGTALSFVLYKQHIIWARGSPALYLAPYNSKRIEIFRLNMTGITEVAVHDLSLMTDKRGPCTIGNGGCEQICLSGKKRSVCRCHHGYSLQTDGSCRSYYFTEHFALVSDVSHNRIYQIPLYGGQEKALGIPFIDGPLCAVYNKVTRKVIWTEKQSNEIKSAFLNGSNIDTLYSIETGIIRYIAVDHSTGNIYFTTQNSSNVNYIGVFRRTFSTGKTLVPDLDHPVAIALYPSKGIMFWTDAGASPYIGKARMDGLIIFKRIFPHMKWPTGITVDYKADNIYWTDGYYDTIQRCDINGANMVLIAHDADAHPIDIVYMGSYLYYTAWNRRKVTKMDKTGTIVQFMSDSPELGRLDSLYMFPSEPQPIHTACAERNGRCSVFCLPKEHGHTCGCPDNQNLESDKRTCDGALVCPNVIPNGKLSLSCLRYMDEECQYTCNKGFKKPRGINVIKCDSSGSWNEDIDGLCEEIKCPALFQGGSISTSCDRNIRSECSFTCQDNYEKTTDVSFVTCLSDGQWDRSPDILCLEIKCPALFQGGSISTSCDRNIRSECSFTCQDNYEKTTDVSFVTCLSDGQWDRSPDILCLEIKCPALFQGGSISTSCDRNIRSECSFTCQDNYEKTTDVSFVTCLSDGQWDQSPEILCLVRDTSEKSSVGFVLPLAVILVCVVIVIAFVWYRRRRTARGRHTTVYSVVSEQTHGEDTDNFSSRPELRHRYRRAQDAIMHQASEAVRREAPSGRAQKDKTK